MAEYGRVGSASDYMRNEAVRAQETKTSRIQRNVIRTTTFDFGPGPYTVEDMREFARAIEDMPPGAKLGIRHGEDREGESLTITVVEG